MQVKTNFADYCPLILDEDVLSINSSVVIKGQRLYDVTTGALHCLRPEGMPIVQKLFEKVPFSQLKQTAVESDIRQPQLRDLLGFLNLVGCLSRSRSMTGQIKSSVRQLRVRRRYKPLYKRTDASLTCIAWQTILVCLPLIVASVLVCSLMLLAGASLSAVLKLGTIWNVLLVGSIYAHEVAHYAVLRHESIRSDVIRHGLRIGLLHRSLDPMTEAILALAGPACGLLSCLTGVIICEVSNFSTGVFLASVVGCLHLASLLPWYGDGTNLRLAVHQWRRA